MDIHEARRVLNAAKAGEDISPVAIRAALYATGDLDCTFGGKREQALTQGSALPSQQVMPDPTSPVWKPTRATVDAVRASWRRR